MTEITTDQAAQLQAAIELPDGIEPVVPAGVDPIDALTVTELDIASRQLRCDVYEAVGGKDGLRWAALARIAWLWAKRRDERAKLQPFVDLTGAQLTHVLRLDEDDDQVDQVDDDVEANPTEHAPGS